MFEGVGSLAEIDEMPVRELLKANTALDAWQAAKAKAQDPKNK